MKNTPEKPTRQPPAPPVTDRAVALCDDVRAEVLRAIGKHGFYASAHEAMGVLEEEVWEFKLEVFKRRERRDPAAMRAELIQIAAVAVKAAACLT